MAEPNSTPTTFRKCGHARTPENVVFQKKNGREYAVCRTCRKIHRDEFGNRNPFWTIWKKLKSRCLNSNDPRWLHYGGRGITVCDRWRESYAAFEADMGHRPSAKHSVERRDNDRGYSPDNCYWATPSQQQRNTRVNHLITHNGKTLTMVEWSEITGLKELVIYNRLKRGWTVEEALTIKVASIRHCRNGELRATPGYMASYSVPVGQ